MYMYVRTYMEGGNKASKLPGQVRTVGVKKKKCPYYFISTQ